ncbi:hypothetical protein LEP1GSC021_4454 [Leptospira noguchii str. 1993005606]|uniref:Uncharacterized protein n=2 Tax=Leptospira noguchii TaxID=28182 RepID=M6YC50_9LEPT|nr:hypothetical protein [Leptospira noguchii]EMN02434.1 hypothetical protein LEP1GSC035_1637 [Leptospira noguchii str. 2007001578]EMO87224.1 hypothetical protein LEP1GSC024_2343 [Leptospira noguchii str. 2001034031]EPE83850.1 hypothetical protein LEP1GSC021_4454 [Leptospira noguchii str. 1993005606]
MELFAVLAINAVVSVVLYYTITSKVTERIRTHMLGKINGEIRDFIDELETESLRQVDLMGARILTFKEITSKAEELVKRIEQATSSDILEKIQIVHKDSVINVENKESENSYSLKNGNYTGISGFVQQGIGHIYKENLDLIKEDVEDFSNSKIHTSYIQKSETTSKVTKREVVSKNKSEILPQGSTSNLVLETIGKGVRKFFGIQEIKTVREEDETSGNDFFPGTRNSTLDISLDENPFTPVSESKLNETSSLVFKDNLKPKEADFGRILQENIVGYQPIKPDSTKISAEAALLEIGEDSTKIEKVVFLLKRKYTHEEISEVLDLALGEVDIIERFRLDRNRRF